MIQVNQNLIKFATRIALFIMCLSPMVLHAAEEPQETVLKGASLINGASITTTDPVFNTAGWASQSAFGVMNLVQFEIDFDNIANKFFHTSTFNVKCTLNITCYGNPLNPTQVTKQFNGQVLEINYNPAAGATYKGAANIKFDGAYKVVVQVVNIQGTGITVANFPIFKLTNKLIVNRQYNFNPLTIDDLKYTTDGKKLNLSWVPTLYPGAESFDLEWTYVDELSAAGILINTTRTNSQQLLPSQIEGYFRNNSSRVNLSGSSYEFNLNFNKGFLLFRLRGVQYRQSDGLRMEGNWNYDAQALPGSVYNYFNLGIVDVNWHEQNLNWQYNAVYAEDGKKKEVISYFDGSLRSRQSVTINNEDHVAVVAESIFDALGRPAMSILPAPVSDNKLEYYRLFNLNNALKPVSYKDIPYEDCDITAAPLNPASGVEKYYSASNAFLADATKPWNKAIPKSEGFPFAVTMYTPDNTGRIRAQGGVGANFQLGSGHETKYYYGKPSQYELDRLFGAEVGDHTHYLKNMVVDANGQVSVSYVNSEGKTIATALAGTPPTDKVEALPGSDAPLTVTKDILLTPSSFQVNTARSSLEATATFLVPYKDPYKFTYRFTPEQYTEGFTGGTLCYTCTYDLVITLTNDCGVEYERVEINDINPFNTNCTPPQQLSGIITTDPLDIGEYTVHFELLVDKETLNQYTQHYLDNNTDIKKLNYFLLEQLVQENIDECYSDCEACKTLPETLTGFQSMIEAFYEKEGIPFGSEEQEFAAQLYDKIKENCSTLSAQCIPNPCEEILDILRSDVIPGGQYAEYDQDYYMVSPLINVLRFYTQGNYKDEYGAAAMVENDNGVMVPPSQLSLREFIDNFEASWADELVKFHPEYCYYDWCSRNTDSRIFDQKIEDLNDALQARDEGIFDRNNALALLQADPFFNSGYGVAYNSVMENDLLNYSNSVLDHTSQSTKDILQTIDYVLYCGNQDPVISWDDCNKDPNDECRSDYKEWLLYKEWYLARKLKYYYMAMHQAMPGCKNCFIPSSAGADPASWANCTAPPVSAFSISNVEESTADGLRRILISYQGGNSVPQWPLKLRLQLTNTSTGFSIIQDIVFAPGFPTQEMLVQEEFDNVVILSVTCVELTSEDVDGLQRSAAPSNKTMNKEGVWECPNEKMFDVSFQAMPTGGHQVTVCYTGPAIPVGQSVVVRVLVDGVCGPIEYDVVFCSGGPVCDMRTFFSDRDPCDRILEVRILEINCKEGDCSWECPTGAENFSLTTSVNPATGLHEVKLCYSGPSIPYNKTIVVPVRISCGKKFWNIEFRLCQGETCKTYTLTPEQSCLEARLDVTLREFYCIDAPCSEPCPDAGKFSAAVNGAGSCSAAAGYSSANIRVTHAGGALSINQPLERVVVKVLVTTLNSATNQTFTEERTVTFQNGNLFKDLCFVYPSGRTIAGITILGVECKGACPDGDCCNDVRYELYAGKVKRFQEYYESDLDAAMASYNNGSTNFTAYPMLTCKNECEQQADGWMQDLQNCPYIDAEQKERIRRRLIEVCQSGCVVQAGNGDLIYPYSDANPYPSFESVLIDEFGSLMPDCAYDLISDPYPFGKRPIQEKTFATETNPEICARLEVLKTEASGKGYATDVDGLHQYLTDYYTPWYDLEKEELEDLFKACDECEGILSLPVELPPFMDGDAKECLDCETYERILNDFFNKYPGVSISHPKFEVLFRNFANHQTGFSHAFASYYDFQTRCDENQNDFREFGKLCETPLQLEISVDLVGQCIEEKFYNSLANATVAYTAYIEEVKRIFRNNYTAKCLSAKPELESEAKVYEYHYTLYYYDQSSNLVKTVPPKGVQFLSDLNIQQLRQNRNLPLVPTHTLATYYMYNSFNQVVRQNSPDGGNSEFWYDKLGRLVVSQNEEQKTPVNGGAANRYSYTRYEPVLGRIMEVGEKSAASSTMTNTISKNPVSLDSWLNSGTDTQITLTIYDKPDNTVVTNTSITNEQQFYTSRKRVVSTLFRKTDYVSASQYDAATHYSYDVNGNARIVWQENTRLKEADATTQGLKRMDYEFDLVSGKVNKVYYQKGKGDQFIYKYEYDAENRVVAAKTSRDGLVWQNDATYRYYLHGPLARTELGSWKVQGIDYAYTLQGWMKYINGPSLNEKGDIGRDGDYSVGTNVFKGVSRDVMSYAIDYFSGEYKPIQNGSPLNFTASIPGTMGTGKNLYNGNIRATTVHLSQLGGAKTYSYSYDQLNRIVKMRKHETTYTYSGSGTPVFTVASPTTEYQENVSYDANGNILTYLRNGSASQLSMDNLTYRYANNYNRLTYVDDAVNAANYSVDIDDQNSGNYGYDRIGNLIKDVKEQITNIEWTVYGKIRKITKSDAALTTIEYEYDGSGNRIYRKKQASGIVNHTFYIRNSQGNVVSIYTKVGTTAVSWTEQHLYGNSRTGMANMNMNVPAAAPLPAPGSYMLDGFDYGKTVYEMSNHLGNVLATVSDKKNAVQNGSTGIVSYFVAVEMTQTDYYPGGMQMPGRKYSFGNSYRYAFQNQEIDAELWGGAVDFKHRVADSRLNRFLSVDPLMVKYPHNSPYAFSENRLIDGRELEGLEYISIHHYENGEDVAELWYKSSDFHVWREGGTTSGFYNAASYGPLGKGVVHYFYDSKGKLIKSKTRWDNQRKDMESRTANHGLYSGPGCVTDEAGNYDWSYQPIDWADAIAKRHDMDYAEATKSGEEYAGYLEDIRTVQADRDMIVRVKNILVDINIPFKKNGVEGVETPFRKSSSGEMVAALTGQLIVIKALATYKQWKIDNNYGNKDTYDNLREKFKKDHAVVAKIIDTVKPDN